MDEVAFFILQPLKERRKEMENTMEIVKRDRYFALYDQGELVCVTVYRKGALEVRKRIEDLKARLETAQKTSGAEPHNA